MIIDKMRGDMIFWLQGIVFCNIRTILLNTIFLQTCPQDPLFDLPLLWYSGFSLSRFLLQFNSVPLAFVLILVVASFGSVRVANWSPFSCGWQRQIVDEQSLQNTLFSLITECSWAPNTLYSPEARHCSWLYWRFAISLSAYDAIPDSLGTILEELPTYFKLGLRQTLI